MTPNEFIELALRTESNHKVPMPIATHRLLHAGMGMATESGEFLDQLKKHIFYGKQLDETNLKEELGDLLWYMAIACESLGVHMEELFAMVIDKLQIRYPDKFTLREAENRNLEAERASLEKSHGKKFVEKLGE